MLCTDEQRLVKIQRMFTQLGKFPFYSSDKLLCDQKLSYDDRLIVVQLS